MEKKDDNSIESLKILYNEVSQNLRFIADWRYNCITRYIITLSAMIVASGWLATREIAFLEKLEFIPFLLITVITVAFVKLEKRNTKILDMLIKTGLEIERKISNTAGLYEGLANLFLNSSSTFLLRIFYIIISIISLIVSILLIFINW
jgi:hypothetical protein